MNIEPNNEGWRFDESFSWKLIHNNIDVIFFEETDASISTQENLFIGTKEECDSEILNLGLNPVLKPQTEEETTIETTLLGITE